MTRIAIFAKAPLPGQVKTRLIPALGPDGAAALARRMLADTCREALAARTGTVELCLSGSLEKIPEGVELSRQGEGDLGERLARAAERVIGKGEAVMFIGTDCPALNASRLKQASAELERNDAVIHPTFDGGYALLGLKRYDASIFNGIEWSTSTVAADTIGRISALGWSLHVGETLLDIDEPEDLEASGRAEL
ncbi:MAG TPA: TIGR04282 family arsenosugar biosynthesis glycosyltransferase [Allosphingosinicella sp.]|nr:TIGR04282 family arsenosugar biosynthesis glycosyltransferase [Allosphingosinicella sp.]